MTALKKKVQRGFTLVELLIVIALLAIIALIVIAAINPIEQRNRARDTGMRSDSAQLVSALDRFYTAREEYTWTDQGFTANDDQRLDWSTAAEWYVGICGDATTVPPATNCDVEGVLIETDELKPEFVNRNFIDAFTQAAPDPIDQLWLFKAFGASQSVYICYTPLSKSNRDTSCESGEVYDRSALTGGNLRIEIPADDPTCEADAPHWTDEGGVGGPYVICVPE